MPLRGYRARWIVDGTGNPAHPGTVLVENQSIVDVIRRGQLPSDAEITDLGDVALLPGLIDAHVHLIWAGAEPNPEEIRALAESPELQSRHLGRRSLPETLEPVEDEVQRELEFELVVAAGANDRGVVMRDLLHHRGQVWKRLCHLAEHDRLHLGSRLHLARVPKHRRLSRLKANEDYTLNYARVRCCNMKTAM